MGSTIASLLVPLLFISFGVLVIVFRAPISTWYQGVYRNSLGSRGSRVDKAFNTGTMILLGSFAILVGAGFLIANIARLF